MIITVDHARKLGFCAKGIRRWCANKGLDYNEFVQNGLDSSVLEPFADDVMVQELLKEAKK